MTVDRVMLLIDADNVSVDVMEQGLRLLMNQHGGVHVRRAYCTAESAVKHQAFFKRMGIKPMVNLAAGKNSTDIALAVDAIDLVLAERPDVVVIASSDSDFAPLVQRLREKGCVVRGIGQKGKTGDETREVYDDYTVFEHRKGGAATRVAERQAPSARKTAARGEGRGRGRGAGRGEVPAEERAATAVVAAAPAPAQAPLPVVVPVEMAIVPEVPPAAPVEPEAVAEELAPKKAPAARKTAAAKTATAAKKTPAAKKAPAAKKEPAAKKTAAAKKTPAAKKAPAARKTKAVEAEAAAATEQPQAVELPLAPPPTPAPPPAPRPAPVGAVAPARAPAARSPAPSRLQDVLRCLPELGEGRSLALNVAVQRLREAQLLGKNSSSLKLFSQLSDRFELLPPGKPSQVSWRP